MKPVAFVIPWYGDDIKGGAESECNQLAHLFRKNGIPVEVLTTCVRQASDDRGKNTMKSGARRESGILVRRFRVKPQNLERFIPANLKIFRGEYVTPQEEMAYLEEDINSPDMYRYIREHQDQYSYFLFIPYLYGTTYFGSLECPDNAAIIPCFHDEGYAHMSLMKERVKAFKKMIFLSKPECDLAHRLYDLSTVESKILGAYVESGWEEDLQPDRFRRKYNITEPFILYAGRKDPGKKADLLIEYYCRFKREQPSVHLDLVLIGGGEIPIPGDCKSAVHDLGFVAAQDKYDAFAAAYLLCNPSFYESFSIVIMESWLARRPVLVAEQCEVTTNFCRETNGGLWYDSYHVFKACVEYLLEHPDEADEMGTNGLDYVKKHFIDRSIIKRYRDFLFPEEDPILAI